MSDFPVRGQLLKVPENTTLEEIATKAYGDPALASKIWGANKGRTDSTVQAGETLVIPGEAPATKLTGKSRDEMTFVIGGIEIRMVAARITRTMDTGTSGWSGRMVWNPGLDDKIDFATRPYGYSRAAAYIGNDLLVSGTLYIVEPELTDTGLTKVLTGFSFTADAVDSNLQPPYEYSGVTLEQLGAALIPQFGIKAVFETGTGGPFERVTGRESDTVFAFFSKLATQRGVLVGDTLEGDLLFHTANTEGKPVGTIEETQPLAIGWRAKYDGRKRFSVIKVITPSGAALANLKWGQGAKPEDTAPVTHSAVDGSIPRYRFQTYRADNVTKGNVENAARWRKNRQFVEALTLPFPVAGWYAPDGSRWAENTLVTVVSPTLGVPLGFTFLIRSVEFILEDKRTAVLQLVPPQAYTNKEIGDVWKLESE